VRGRGDAARPAQPGAHASGTGGRACENSREVYFKAHLCKCSYTYEIYRIHTSSCACGVLCAVDQIIASREVFTSRAEEK
jgi:hypothetical protein